MSLRVCAILDSMILSHEITILLSVSSLPLTSTEMHTA
jgi:hypothetical protein